MSLKDLTEVYIHYNGHGTVRLDNSTAHEAGQWVCSTDTLIQIEEFISICSLKASKQDKKMTVTIVNDCCGSAGVYFRLNKVLNEESL
jgi:hypothetical protein